MRAAKRKTFSPKNFLCVAFASIEFKENEMLGERARQRDRKIDLRVNYMECVSDLLYIYKLSIIERRNPPTSRPPEVQFLYIYFGISLSCR